MVAVADRGHEKIDAAVVVVVARGHRAPPVAALEARPAGDVLESALPVVVVEAVARSALAPLLPLEGRAVDDEQVQEAVSVVVDPGGAVAPGLGAVGLT